MKPVNTTSGIVSALLMLFCVFPALAAAVPSAIIALPENEHAILVEKQSQTFYIYKNGSEGIKQIYESACSTGEVTGPKEKAGDKKTPEGVYFLIDEYEDKYLTPIYGKKAFPTDYPNFVDRRRGKNGSAIWIHGTDKALKPMDSNGCVAMENADVVKLSDYIRLNATPLIILENMGLMDAETRETRKAELTNLVNQWTTAMEQGSYHDYLAVYSEAYVPDISWWEAWLDLRRRAREKKSAFRVIVSNLGMYQHDGMTVILMDFYLVSGGDKQHLGKRKLFLVPEASQWRIVGDVFQAKAKPFQQEATPLLAGARKMSVPFRSDPESAVETVKRWLAAWSSKDMDAYGDFYAPGFRSEGLTKTAWVKRKKALARRYDYIKVTGKNYKTIKKKDGIEVRFLQNYESSGFSTSGIKHLKLVKKGGSWKISQENWKGK